MSLTPPFMSSSVALTCHAVRIGYVSTRPVYLIRSLRSRQTPSFCLYGFIVPLTTRVNQPIELKASSASLTDLHFRAEAAVQWCAVASQGSTHGRCQRAPCERGTTFGPVCFACCADVLATCWLPLRGCVPVRSTSTMSQLIHGLVEGIVLIVVRAHGGCGARGGTCK